MHCLMVGMRSTHLFSVIAVGLATGCVIHTSEPASSTYTTGADIRGSSAVRRIADARCDRAAACDDVGTGRKWANRDACLREMSRDARSTLDDKSCERNGIDESRLNTCIKDIRSERCGNPFDSIERGASCRRAELCK